MEVSEYSNIKLVFFLKNIKKLIELFGLRVYKIGRKNLQIR